VSASSETAHAKVNLALHVRGKQPDGYHAIETVFAFCEAGDVVSAESDDSISLRITGPFGEALKPDDNLVIKAATALQEASGTRAGASLHLRKFVPVASGIGGGSADAAAALRLLNRLWSLGWPDERLEEVARELGADVPACVRSETMRGMGRGDELEPADLGLSGRPILLVNPRVELSTAEVFARWDGIDRGALDGWREGRNDLEVAAKQIAPQIDGILAWVSAQRGAECVRMSGSGATCFALFRSEADCAHAAEGVPREWWRLATCLR
jgi:4-diphosphocytidyl-2-C-methyl-D-erythritol kinase